MHIRFNRAVSTIVFLVFLTAITYAIKTATLFRNTSGQDISPQLNYNFENIVKQTNMELKLIDISTVTITQNSIATKGTHVIAKSGTDYYLYIATDTNKWGRIKIDSF